MPDIHEYADVVREALIHGPPYAESDDITAIAALDVLVAAAERAETLAAALVGVRERYAPDGLPCWCPDWVAEDWRVGDGIEDDELVHHDCCIAARAVLAAADTGKADE